MQAVAILILVGTVGMALGRPRFGRLQFGHAEAAVLGALLALVTGVLNPAQALKAVYVLSFPVITIVSLMIITLVAERSGLLDVVAFRLAQIAKGNTKRLFASLFFVGTLIGTVFTNDAAILILTPFVFLLVEKIALPDWRLENKIPFYFAVLYIGNLVGALTISNPINIVVTNLFEISFLTYATWMLLPAVASILITLFGLRIFFRDQLLPEYKIPTAGDAPDWNRTEARRALIVICLTLLGFFTGNFTGVPVWAVAMAGAGVLLAAHRMDGNAVVPIIRRVGWDVIIFLVGIFIVVIGLRNQGFAHVVAEIIRWLGQTDIMGLSAAAGFVAALFSALFNNHPTAGLMIWVIEDFQLPSLQTNMLVFSALIGGDLGPKMLPIGSLAALMWFRILGERGVSISYWLYIRIGVPVTLIAVAASLFVLNMEWLLYQYFAR